MSLRTGRPKRFQRKVLTLCLAGGCLALSGLGLSSAYAQAAGAAVSFGAMRLAQNTLPQSPETPVSPATPGTLPGTMAGPNTTTGTNPITGAPCIGGGSSALNGGIPGTPNIAGQTNPSTNPSGLPPNNSVYGLNSAANPGAC